MTHRQILAQAVEKLKTAGITEADNDARLLWEYAFNMSRTGWLMYADCEADAGKIPVYEEYIERRASHEPLQYIEGKAYFMGLEFMVNDSVLIPRFDTEVLVDNALKCIPENSQILDVCTGSGCIAISLSVLGGHKVTGVDISKAALEVAESNRIHNSADKVSFYHSDMFSAVDGVYDCIVSNPPYIRTADIDALDHEVKVCEPMLALDGHDDGLFFYRILAKESGKYLRENGLLMVEIGCDQAEDVMKLFRDNNYTDIRVIKDLAGLDRVVCGWRK